MLPFGIAIINSDANLELHTFLSCILLTFHIRIKNLNLLVQKLVSVLETIEKLPVYLFDHKQTFSIGNLQRKFHIELRREPCDTVLRDYTGKHFRAEPLILVRQLEKYLYTKLTNMWYDYERNDLNFIKIAKSHPIQFNFTGDFDKQGIFYWMGTNAWTCEYSNPHDIRLVNITSSDGLYPASGFLSDFLSRDTTPHKSYIGNKKDSWLMLDLGLWFIPTMYSIRHAAGFENSGLRNWRFEGSKNGRKWQLLSKHENDSSLVHPGSTCSWPVKAPEDETEGWRFFRIKITGPDASGKYFYICISGIELYGMLTGVAGKPKTYQHEQVLNKKRQLIQQLIIPQLKQGSKVRKGLDFNWEEELSDSGTVTGDLSSDGWIEVKWDNGNTNSYRMGAGGKYDLYLENLLKPPEPDEDVMTMDVNSVLCDQASLLTFDISQNAEDDLEIDASTEGTQSIPEFPQGIELRGEYSDLLPPYDPRPGQYNIPVMQPLTLPNPEDPKPKQLEGSEVKSITGRLALSLKLTKIKTEKKDELIVPLDDPSKSLFYYLNKAFMCSDLKKFAKPWDATYELIYKLHEDETNECQPALLSRNRQHNSIANQQDNSKTFFQVLKLLSQIRFLSSQDNSEDATNHVTQEEYHSKKVTNKILMQIKDPLSLTSDALPEWISQVLCNYSFVIPFECRMKYFKSKSFGPTRSIVWLQERHKDELDRNRSNLNVTTSRSEEHHEFRLGRLKVDIVTVSRNLTLQQAKRVMEATCSRKAILEIQYENEEGTGLGPSLEFYSLVATELQKVEQNMWLNDHWEVTSEAINNHETTIESGVDENEKRSKFVHFNQGLFPAPYPPNSESGNKVSELFNFLGIFLAKALQDDRIVDLPLSTSFLKLLCAPSPLSPAVHKITGYYKQEQDSMTQGENSPLPELAKENDSQCKERAEQLDTPNSPTNRIKEKPTSSYGVLNHEDFKLLYPAYASLTQELTYALKQQRIILDDSTLSELEKTNKIQDLNRSVESLYINFTYCPETCYGYDKYQLITEGEEKTVTLDNAELYIDSIQEFLLRKGIQKQLESFRAGFNTVFPMNTLSCFQPEELRLVACGEQVPNWTREDLLNFTEAKNGYDKMSTAYLMFTEVATNFTPSEKKAFVQFVTGSSSLPPGGLANLHPRLCVVRKSTTYEGTLPSVNTCFHYLKLPEYKTEEEMHLCLMAATKEKGFHLN
ncbi:E3 ubiquitin-protein ligase HECTD1 isoform X6 [Oopsacas minuta]|uniref:E3 ubiquitin-protein ligase n=1 Tax=Oopsacas minuta TaxID=111878 RepID=A0AAV7K9Z4_9METZ|nr:E3 ubiquitin-protein ligase HECTD1 isoform X6 [Oopsacas minuta]